MHMPLLCVRHRDTNYCQEIISIEEETPTVHGISLLEITNFNLIKTVSRRCSKALVTTFMTGKWHLGGKVPPAELMNKDKYFTDPRHNWTLPIIDGPQDIGFDHSIITTGGIQEAPYSFFRNGFLTTNIMSDVQYWNPGSYQTPIGESVINRAGEGDVSWDSSAYNVILVNETSAFIDRHLRDREKDPFFAYIALDSVHVPHSPPNHYLNGAPIAN
jgi:arylsulfatase A